MFDCKLIKYNGVYDKLDQYKSIITLNLNNLIDNRVKKSSFSIQQTFIEQLLCGRQHGRCSGDPKMWILC